MENKKNMKKLVEIIQNFNLFKSNHLDGTDKEFSHKYVSFFYQSEFEKIQTKELKLLEIGTCTGASLKMWKEFFVNGKIEGVDNTNLLMDEYKDGDVTYYIDDAYRPEFVNSLQSYDIIIDDGPHDISSQLLFIELYHDKLNSEGYMVIEDVDSDENIKLIIDKFEKIFGKTPNTIDNREIVGLSNEVIIWIKK